VWFHCAYGRMQQHIEKVGEQSMRREFDVPRSNTK
jgi:hypothetical protein